MPKSAKSAKSADQSDSDDPALISKEVLAEIAENAPPIGPGETSMAPIADVEDGPEEPKFPKRGGLPPENDPPAA